uniref:Reverse transcriptase domain-containing protein n=1 Tax=Tanacetum cinerariifolium TaxID=118510 RepID=A0A699IBM7_TANCI|nr:hypothetical protein [Tanacetum cinerariifolium]
MNKDVFQAKGDLIKSIHIFLEKFNHIPFGEKPDILLQAWEKFFAFQHAQPEDMNKLFQKLREDLQIINKELEVYINSPSWDRPTFFNDNEEHFVQYKEYLENSSTAIAVSNQEKEKPPQNSDIQFYCMHNDVDDLIESALNSKLLSINLESQRLDKKKQEVKNIIEQPTERRTRIAKSLQNFRVNKSSNSLNNSSQISPVHAITPVLPIEEPEYSLSMGYEHLSIIPETESNEVTKSSAKNLLPIPSEYEVTFDDESACDMPDKDDSSLVFTTFSNLLFNDNDDFTSSDDEINSDEIDPHCFNVESDFVESLSNRNALIDSSPKFDYLEEFSGAFMPTSIADEERIMREHAEYISLMERLFTINPCPQIDIFTGTDELLPPSFESDDYDSKMDINVLKELLVDDSISLPKNELFYFDHEDDPSLPHPPPEPPDVEFDFEPN